MIRRLMSQVEQDLDTTLDWVAVDHFNTGHPHSHIMLRGVDDRRKNLIIAREYMSNGLRERAAAIVNLDLGPDRKSVGEGKSVSVRVDLGGGRIIKTKKRKKKK